MKYHIYVCKFQNKKPNFTSFIKGIRDTEDLIAKKGQTFCLLQKNAGLIFNFIIIFSFCVFNFRLTFLHLFFFFD